MKTTHLFLGAASICLAAACATDVSAQAAVSPAPAADTGLETVVVTAQKRVEQAQKTPISMTVVTTQEIKNRSIVSLSDIQQLTPGLMFEASTTNQFGANVSIRGLTGTGSGESPVGIYVDGVYETAQNNTGTGTTALTSLFDVARIEVLKGPQSTLYGRNTTGGAINIITNLPTQDPMVQMTAGIGNYNSGKIQAILNAPLVKDVLALRVAGQWTTNSGYAEDVVNGVGLGSARQWNVRATLLYTPTPKLQFVLRGDYAEGSGGGPVIDPISIDSPLLPGPFAHEEIALERGLPLTSVGLAEADAIFKSLSTGTQPNLNNQQYFAAQSSSFSSGGVSLTATYDLADNLTLKSITAYRRDLNNATVNNSGLPFQILVATVPGGASQVTQELQFNGNLLDNRLNFVSGLYYYYAEQQDDSIANALVELLPLFPPGNDPNPSVTLGDRHDSSFALYGQATYAITPQLNITGGLRWTTEDKDLVSSSFNAQGCQVPTINLINGQCLGKFMTSANNLSYSANIEYNVTNTVMLYAKTSSGFKSGGINQGSSLVNSYGPFLPETVTDYEVGIKSDWFDHRLRLDLAAYQSNYSNLQRTVVNIVDGALVEQILNAASARIQGVEGELDAQPINNLLIQATVAYVNPKYLKYVDALGDDLSGQLFEDQPTWTYSLTGAYTWPTSFGHVRGEVDWSWRSAADLFPSALPGDFHIQPAYGLLNARLSVHVDAIDLDVALWGKNLANQLYFAEIADLTSQVGSDEGYVGAPRTFGVEFTKTF